jgi:hypothetical protein
MLMVVQNEKSGNDLEICTRISVIISSFRGATSKKHDVDYNARDGQTNPHLYLAWCNEVGRPILLLVDSTWLES